MTLLRQEQTLNGPYGLICMWTHLHGATSHCLAAKRPRSPRPRTRCEQCAWFPRAERDCRVESVIRLLAENANAFVPLGPGEELVETDRFVLWLGRSDRPNDTVAQRFRMRPDEADAT